MTSNSEKLRSLFLAGLMVFSVFAGTVALTGSAAAVGGNTDGAPSEQKATHYVAAGDTPVVEVAFDEQIQVDGDTEITITLEDGTTVGPILGTNAGVSTNGGQLKVNTGQVYNDVDSIEVVDVEDQQGNDATVSTSVVFASSSVDTQTDEAEFEAYRGENVTIYNATDLETRFDIEGDGPSFDVVRGASNNSEVYVWNTTSRELGDYNISDRQHPNDAEVTLTLQELGLNVTPDETTFDDDEQINTTVEMDDINRPVSVRLLDDDGDAVAYDNRTTNSEGELESSFAAQEDGNYTVEVEDLNSGITDESDEFEVVDAGDEEADFGQSIYEDQRGDVVNLTVEMDNTDEATIQVGTSDDDNYYAIADVTDDDEDGVAYVEFNSFLAGNDTLEDDILTAGDDDTIVENVDQGGRFYTQSDNNAPVGSNLLESAQYELLAVSGHGVTGEISDEDNVGTLSLQERSTDNAQVWTASEDSYSELTSADAEDFTAYAEANNLTQADSIANADTLVVQVEASGLEGALATGDDTQVYKDASNESRLFDLVIEEGSSAPNADPLSVNVGDLSDSAVVYDADADTHYVVLNSTEVVEGDTSPFDYEDGDTYEANFTVYGDNDGNDLADENVSVTDDFDVVDRDATIDTNDDGEVVVEAASGQEVTGTTNLAPGTELTIRLRSDTDGSPFLKQPEPVVQEDGSFTATADFSDVSPGATFNARVRLGGSDIGDEEDGVVVEATATETPDNVTDTPEDTETDTPETDMPDTDMPDTDMPDTDMPDTDTPTEADGPGFGVVAALIALIGAALLAVRRNN